MPSLSPAIAQMFWAPARAHRKREQEFGIAAATPGSDFRRSRPLFRHPIAEPRAERGDGHAPQPSERSPAITVPTSRASPSIASPRMSGVRPPARAALTAACSANNGEAIMRTSAGDLARLRRFGARFKRRAHCGRQIEREAVDDFVRLSLACSGRAWSDPTRSPPGSSPGTSQITSVTTRAGYAAAASRPPLIAREMLADDIHLADRRAAAQQRPVHGLLVGERHARLPAASSTPSRRPRSSAITRSSAVSPRTTSSMAPRRTFALASGTGCAASMNCGCGRPGRRGRSA